MLKLNNIALTYADLKHTDIAELAKDFAVQVTKDATPDMMNPNNCENLLEGHKIPEKLVDYVMNRKGNFVNISREIGALVYDIWKHQNDDINDLYTVHLETLYGVKNITYKDEHPNIAQMETIHPGFKERYQHSYFGNQLEEEEICHLIAMEVAYYILGEDFHIFFNIKLELLPDDMREAFITDAKAILEELKAS